MKMILPPNLSKLLSQPKKKRKKKEKEKEEEQTNIN